MAEATGITGNSSSEERPATVFEASRPSSHLTGRESSRQTSSAVQQNTEITASLVICAYTEARWEKIGMALASVARQTVQPLEIIVVTDYNPDLCRRLRAEYPKLTVVPNRFAQGLSGARNTGIEIATAEIVVFLDDDAHAEPDWLQAMLAPYQDETVIGVGGKILPDWEASAPPYWLPEEFLWVVGCSYRGLPEENAQVRNPIGANMSFRRAAFEAAGRFDSSVGRNNLRSRPLGCEETELSIRILAASPKSHVVYEPGAVVHHYVDNSRATWRYFVSRCLAEGYSKAHVAGLAGASAALSVEKSYVFRTLRRAVERDISMLARHRDGRAAARLAALALGVTVTGIGYLSSMATHIRSGRHTRKGSTV